MAWEKCIVTVITILLQSRTIKQKHIQNASLHLHYYLQVNLHIMEYYSLTSKARESKIYTVGAASDSKTIVGTVVSCITCVVHAIKVSIHTGEPVSP